EVAQALVAVVHRRAARAALAASASAGSRGRRGLAGGVRVHPARILGGLVHMARLRAGAGAGAGAGGGRTLPGLTALIDAERRQRLLVQMAAALQLLLMLEVLQRVRSLRAPLAVDFVSVEALLVQRYLDPTDLLRAQLRGVDAVLRLLLAGRLRRAVGLTIRLRLLAH